MIERGSIHWADLGDPTSHRPAKRRPVLVVQADAYTRSRLGTVIVVALTSNTDLAALPGNAFLPAAATGLPRDSVVNVTAVLTLDKHDLDEYVGTVPHALMRVVDDGLRRVLAV